MNCLPRAGGGHWGFFELLRDTVGETVTHLSAVVRETFIYPLRFIAFANIPSTVLK